MTMQDIHTDKILILDFGSQYTQLIARRVREIGVYCEIMPWDADAEAICRFGAKGVILSGGPESTIQDRAPLITDAVFGLDVPLLGICYGMQAMALQLGGKVEAGHHREFGHAEVGLETASPLFAFMGERASKIAADVWMSHGDRVTRLPEGFSAIASTASVPIAGMAHNAKPWFGLQFHPEVTHTTHGEDILRQFAIAICGCEALWTTSHIIEDLVQRARHQAQGGQVLLGLSGGVDSCVVAALLKRALPDQLICVFVDTGLLRYREREQLLGTMQDQLGVKIVAVDAKRRFLDALKGIEDPEAKRKAIGRVFIEVFEEQAAKLPNIQWLAQGTIYSDVIESAGSGQGKSHVIKSHHNVGGLPATMNLRLLEPIRELFKDEVRKLGMGLGLPKEMVHRHPFPGPGLGVRILGEVKEEYIEILAKADHIFIEELRRQGWYERVSQAFAVFLPVKSVGVVGDARAYEWVVALRAVETIDFMTARAAALPHDFLSQVSRRIINETQGISRVVYDISDKPPATIEWE